MPDDHSLTPAVPEKSKLAQTRDFVDGVYQNVTRPDRPVEPEIHKKPWLAALLSLLIVGAGQLYNRQLAKALFFFVLFYIWGGLLLILTLAFSLANHVWEWGVDESCRGAGDALKLLAGGLWIFAVIDAFRTARALRAGTLVVRFTWTRQAVHMLTRFIPFAGFLTPEDTVARESLDQSVEHAAVDKAKDIVWEWFLKRVLRYGMLILGVILLVIGIIFSIYAVTVAGVVVLFIALAAFLT